ncbi:MAG: sugar transferase [Patescibacteria group bacterium]
MLTERHRLKTLGFVLGDLAIFQLAMVVTIFVRYGSLTSDQWSLNALPFFLLSCLWVIVFYIAGLYDFLLIREPIRLFRQYLEGMLANALIGFAFFYLLPFFGIAPRRMLVIQFAVFLLFGYLWRIIVGHYLSNKTSPATTVYIGPASEAMPVARLLEESPLGLRLTHAFVTNGVVSEREGFKVYTDLSEWKRVLEQEQVQVIVLGASPDEHEVLRNAVYQAVFYPITILDRAEIEEAATGRIPLKYVNEAWFLHHLKEADKAWYEVVKRGLDVVMSIPFGVVTILLYPFIAGLIKFSSPGPALFKQTRVGKNGRLFTIWKFRTMHLDSEKHGAQFTADAKTDPRLFKTGRILRQLRIDELPQIWNVFVGDLSFIGPRPERPEFTAPLEEQMPYYKLRHLTRPGLTGWAQVSYLTPTAVLEDNLRKLQYDLFYIKHRSLFLDALILLKTIGVVLRRQGT